MSPSRVLALCALASMLAACCAYRHLQELPQSSNHPHVPDEAIVKFKPGAGQQAMDLALSRGDASILETIGGSHDDGIMVVVRIRGRSVANAVQVIGLDEQVEWVEPNYTYEQHQVQEAEYKNGNLWGLYGSSTTPASPFGTNASAAWDAGFMGNSSVHVGIIDQGVQVTHPDLAANIWVNPRDKVNAVDDDKNGMVDDVNGWNFCGTGSKNVYEPSTTSDVHGTHIAGIIGGVRNGQGIVGVCPNVTMISAKIRCEINATHSSMSTDTAVKAIRYMIALKRNNSVNIVALSNSWGGAGYQSALALAISDAGKANILFVVAAGNNATNVTASPQYPCAYSSSNVICVTAINKTGHLPDFANHGAKFVHLAAPGVDIRSTVPVNGTASHTGTSASVPFVTGAIALYAARYPNANAAQIKAALLSSVAKMPNLAGRVSSGGRLDVFTMLRTPPK